MNLDFSAAKILVVGDVMLDSYWQGSTQRISPEAPVPVVHVDDKSQRIGGSGNVALNITTLGAQAELFALMGDDKEGQQLSELLKSSDIVNQCQVEPSIPTTTKLRVLSQHQQLIRIDFEQPHDEVNLSALLKQFEASLPQAQMVVMSDYAKGLLHDSQPFIQLAKQHDVPVLVDPKKDNFKNYEGAWLLTPNQKEFEAVVGPCNDQQTLILKAREVITQYHFGGLLITQGGAGMTLVLDQQDAFHFPAHAQEVYDVTGAGDTVIATLATAVASGFNINDAVFLSCKAAGIVVSRVGTSSVSIADLEQQDRKNSTKLSPIKNKIVDDEKGLLQLKQLREMGKKVVFTNGCFDLLHAGHVKYLEQASQLGDVLIVAINSDDSVKQLKGDSRPINNLDDRMNVLASLASIDMVWPFSDTTPEQLLCMVKPDILVKGADYTVEQVAGRQYAKEVVLIDLVEGKSSTAMLDKIRN